MCFEKPAIKECPICKVPKGVKPGKEFNIGHQMMAMKSEVLDDFGVTSAMVEAAENSLDDQGRRPGDLDDVDFLRHRISHGEVAGTSGRRTVTDYDSEDDFLI